MLAPMKLFSVALVLALCAEGKDVQHLRGQQASEQAQQPAEPALMKETEKEKPAVAETEHPPETSDAVGAAMLWEVPDEIEEELEQAAMEAQAESADEEWEGLDPSQADGERMDRVAWRPYRPYQPIAYRHYRPKRPFRPHRPHRPYRPYRPHVKETTKGKPDADVTKHKGPKAEAAAVRREETAAESIMANDRAAWPPYWPYQPYYIPSALPETAVGVPVKETEGKPDATKEEGSKAEAAAEPEGAVEEEWDADAAADNPDDLDGEGPEAESFMHMDRASWRPYKPYHPYRPYYRPYRPYYRPFRPYRPYRSGWR